MAVDAVRTHSPTYQAYQILYVGFVVLPILAGLDKFTHLLVDWNKYLAPAIANIVPASVNMFMVAVGSIEVLAGLLVAISPRVGGYIVGLWLLGIVCNLLLFGQYLDIALRDFGLALGAFALARMAEDYRAA